MPRRASRSAYRSPGFRRQLVFVYPPCQRSLSLVLASPSLEVRHQLVPGVNPPSPEFHARDLVPMVLHPSGCLPEEVRRLVHVEQRVVVRPVPLHRLLDGPPDLLDEQWGELRRHHPRLVPCHRPENDKGPQEDSDNVQVIAVRPSGLVFVPCSPNRGLGLHGREKNSLETVGFMMAATYLCQWIFVVAASET